MLCGGERMAAAGEIAPGAFVIQKGRVDVTQRGREGHSELIVTHRPGSFMGELAQLSGRPSLVDAVATQAVEAFVIPPRRLRDLMVEEAELSDAVPSEPPLVIRSFAKAISLTRKNGAPARPVEVDPAPRRPPLIGTPDSSLRPMRLRHP